MTGSAVAIGYLSGQTNQSNHTVAIGQASGNTSQQERAVAVGFAAGVADQKKNAVAIGAQAGVSIQGSGSIAIGSQAAQIRQNAFSIAIGVEAGFYEQGAGTNSYGTTGGAGGAIAIGHHAGKGDTGTDSQGEYAIAMGYFSGTTVQLANSIAIGHEAGRNYQGNRAIAIGQKAGSNPGGTIDGAQQGDAIAIGYLAGETSQGTNSIAIGQKAGNNSQQRGAIAIGQNAQESGGLASIAIGIDAGNTNQGEAAIAIGKSAGTTNQEDKSIIINATGIALENTTASTLKIAPIREVRNDNILTYNTTAGANQFEITHTPAAPLFLPANSTNITNSGDRDLFDDGVVRIWLQNSTTDDIELEITNSMAPPGSVYHVSWTNFQSGGVGGATNVVDLNAGGITSSTTLDFNFTTDEYMTIRIWSPAIGLTWGFYEAKIIKSSSLYTGTPVLCSVRKSF